MNGLKCTELLMEYWKKCMEEPIPIVALSGCTSELEKKACHDVGMLEFISKPIKISTIDYLMKKYL
jgi:CheY-like chemotaxis protein